MVVLLFCFSFIVSRSPHRWMHVQYMQAQSPANNTVWAPCWPHVGGPEGPMWAAHTGPTQNWPGGPQGAHLGDTRGTHPGPTMDPSGPHMGSPCGPHVSPMGVARRASYGRPMWGPRRIGQGGHKGPIWAIHVGPIRDPPWTHLGPTRAAHMGHRWAP